jgi:hypothetical protein
MGSAYVCFRCSHFVVSTCPIIGLTGTIMLEETGFSGNLPSMPASIVNFNAADTKYTGGFIDANFISCVNLNYLDLELNQFSTSIPTVLSSLPHLEFLYLSDTLMTGTLAPLRGMPAIRELWMDANPGLVGHIETWFGELMTLESLSLAYNNLSGELPSELGLLTNMKQIWFYGNNFTGPIPSEIGALSQLTVLQLEGNSLQGWVPPTICEKTEFPAVSLKSFGADCHDDEFWCPCCSCCDLTECLAVSTSTRKERKVLAKVKKYYFFMNSLMKSLFSIQTRKKESQKLMTFATRGHGFKLMLNEPHTEIRRKGNWTMLNLVNCQRNLGD